MYNVCEYLPIPRTLAAHRRGPFKNTHPVKVIMPRSRDPIETGHVTLARPMTAAGNCCCCGGGEFHAEAVAVVVVIVIMLLLSS